MNLGIVDDSVERVALDLGITLITDNGAKIRIETTFTVRSADGTMVDGAHLNLRRPAH